jgi:hypothetical protein
VAELTVSADGTERVATDPGRSSSRLITVLFASTAFVGAGLLFVVQPMIARLLLPAYGGSATVWSTSSLLFQVLLLLGYAYSHWSTHRLGIRWQPRVHAIVLFLPFAALPIALPNDAAPTQDTSPALWLLRTLVLTIGLPFVVVATTGPLLQKWYSWTDGRRADDPYFLFAAGNLGSFAGLLAYPLLVEPTLSLRNQRDWWSIAFAAYAVLTALCAVVVLMSRQESESAAAEQVLAHADARVPRSTALAWLGLAFFPSALMLAVTSYVSTDIAAVPLLWVAPLAIYLATFVAAFSRTSRSVPSGLARLAAGVCVVAAIGTVMPRANSVLIAEISIQMVMLGLVSYVVHARLAARRPDPRHLTYYFLVIAAGGALGGLLNGLIAPTLFDRVLEYPVLLAVVPVVAVGAGAAAQTWLDRLAARSVLWVVVLVALVLLGGGRTAWALAQGEPAPLYAWSAVLVLVGLLAFRMAQQRLVLVALVSLVLVGPMVLTEHESLDQSRTFFGTNRVLDRGGMHLLFHGPTVHGSQFTGEESGVPTLYYARSGPLGDVFEGTDFGEVGVVGLGAGTIAAYAAPDTQLTFFEIDSEVVRIAEDPRFFTYLADSPADIDIEVGDGRLLIGEQPAGRFDLLVLDAFSSDAIPTHLLTTEAMRTYMSRLSPGGLLAIHISNKTFDLSPVLLGAARRLGLSGARRSGGSGAGAAVSDWVVLSADESVVDALVGEDGWRLLSGREVVWTDDFSSVLTVFK